MEAPKRLELYRELEKNPAAGLLKAFLELESQLKKALDEKISDLKDKLPSLAITAGIERLRGNDGVSPKMEDIIKALVESPYFISKTQGKPGISPTSKELLALIKPLIPPAIPGKDADALKIANMLMRNRDFVMSLKGDKGDSGKDIPDNKLRAILKKIKALEELDRKVDTSMSDELAVKIAKLEKQMKVPRASVKVGGGMGNWVHESFTVTAAQASVTLRHRIAAGSTAVLVRYQGQLLAHNVEYSVRDKVVSLNFTTEANQVVDITYVRT